MCAYIANFYLNTPMDCYEYMQLSFEIINQEVFEYNLTEISHNGKVYTETRKGIYGIPQSGKNAHDR